MLTVCVTVLNGNIEMFETIPAFINVESLLGTVDVTMDVNTMDRKS